MTILRWTSVAATAVLILFGAGVANAGPGSGGNAVPVPADYDYDPSLGPVHDYCTIVGNDLPGVDFRGACARHDLCMETYGDVGYEACHSAFGVDLVAECDWSFPPDAARRACHALAGAMEMAVREAN
ncbi:hypothetical protein ACFWFQ_00750 [Nocardia salmonicida]|uniref:hypothetical protein n=1 Tax=Nocardia salmonicida TaxID=53431 RepID=UPI0036473B6B